MQKFWQPVLLPLFLFLLSASGCQIRSELILATTTSVVDTGLMDFLLPKFESQSGISVKVIAAGTGEALTMGRKGDADVLIVHAPEEENSFIKQGYGEQRTELMRNDFLLIGPQTDPAEAKGLEITAALEKIARSKSLFISRGDRSGTHLKEQALWEKAGLSPDPASDAWYFASGQGMAETARIAEEKQAYTIIDSATYTVLKKTLTLVPISVQGADLKNVYSVIIVSEEKCPRVHEKEARAFLSWLTSPEAQKMIEAFGSSTYGEHLFTPLGAP